MIKEALQYVLGLNTAGVETVDGQKYYKTLGNIVPIEPLPEKQPKKHNVTTLSSIVEYIRRGADRTGYDNSPRLIIHVEGPMCVTLKTEAFGYHAQQTTLVEAEPMIPRVQFDQWMDSERFNIYLQAQFVDNADRKALLKCVGNISEENVANANDDGVSQKVVVKTGVVSQGVALVPNPVKLAPYRTFIEVEQPESDFVFRMQSGPKCALFEADGGAWKIEAMKRIAEYFERELSEAIANNKVILLS